MSCSTVILMRFLLREKVINKTFYSSVFISESSCKLVDSWSIISKSASSLSWSKDSNSLFYGNISKNLIHNIQDSSSVFFSPHFYNSVHIFQNFQLVTVVQNLINVELSEFLEYSGWHNRSRGIFRHQRFHMHFQLYIQRFPLFPVYIPDRLMDSGIEFRIFFSQSTVNFVLKTIFDTLTTVHTISDIRKDQGETLGTDNRTITIINCLWSGWEGNLKFK